MSLLGFYIQIGRTLFCCRWTDRPPSLPVTAPVKGGGGASTHPLRKGRHSVGRACDAGSDVRNWRTCAVTRSPQTSGRMFKVKMILFSPWTRLNEVVWHQEIIKIVHSGNLQKRAQSSAWWCSFQGNRNKLIPASSLNLSSSMLSLYSSQCWQMVETTKNTSNEQKKTKTHPVYHFNFEF